jgi:hypothetical protein
VDEEWEMIWKEEIIVLPMYYPGTCQEGLSKAMKEQREIIDESAEMRTKHLPKTNIYSCTILQFTQTC